MKDRQLDGPSRVEGWEKARRVTWGQHTHAENGILSLPVGATLIRYRF